MSDSKRKRGLIVVPRMPFPLNSGGRIAIFDTIQSLSKKNELIIIIIDDDPDNVKYVMEIERFSKEVYFFSKKKYRFWANAILGLINRNPLQIGYFYFKDVQDLINSLEYRCDFFYAFMIRTTSYGLNLSIKKGHYAIDSMYLNYRKSQENTRSIFWKLIYKIEVPLLYKAEKKQLQQYNITTFVNRDEANFWSKFGIVETLPHGVADSILSYRNFDHNYGHVVCFIGRMDYQPNIDAVLWFCQNVVQYLDKGIEFWVVGGYVTTEVANLERQYSNVRIKGFVEDPYIILKSCLCTVAPMQTGGGLQTKILVAMALESLVISSALSISAIENAKDGVNIIVEDDPVNLRALINTIYKSPIEYTHIRQNAKKVIEESYSLPVIESKLYNLLETYL